MVTPAAPGEGPVRPVSVSLHEGTIVALKARTGKRGMSAYVEALIQRQLERDLLRELIEDAEDVGARGPPRAVPPRRPRHQGLTPARPHLGPSPRADRSARHTAARAQSQGP
ncbi:hypothetical protein [Streptomyces zagrosensis]|uniref:Uncharacterized protein n=1 Tax=Streptomyces zagrosensis TaxID=1042984 RepID=A0A7W9UYE8_9ACTN|nr:hypothetical protein [Streptomyces zagrosensis]